MSNQYEQTSQAVLDLGTRQNNFAIGWCVFVKLQHLGVVSDGSTKSHRSQRNSNAHTSVVVLACHNRYAPVVKLCTENLQIMSSS